MATMLGAHSAATAAPPGQVAEQREALSREYAGLVGLKVDHAAVRQALLEHLKSAERRKKSSAQWSDIEAKVAEADVALLEKYLVHKIAHHYKAAELGAIVDFLRSPAGRAVVGTAAGTKREFASEQKQAIDSFVSTPAGKAFANAMTWSGGEVQRVMSAWITTQADTIDPLPAEPARPASGW